MKIATWLVIIIFLAGCSIAGYPGQDQDKNKHLVRVSRVIDGDTFEIVNRGKTEKIRLIGVDTPESVKPGHEVEPYGLEASNYTKKMIKGKIVQLEFDVQERDKYGRLLAYVHIEEDGTFLNAQLLEEGLATVFTVPPNVRYADNFLKIQKKAQQNKKGIWSHIN